MHAPDHGLARRRLERTHLLAAQHLDRPFVAGRLGLPQHRLVLTQPFLRERRDHHAALVQLELDPLSAEVVEELERRAGQRHGRLEPSLVAGR